MAALAAIADDTLRLYPDPVSPRLREAAARRFGVRARERARRQRLGRLPHHPLPRLPRPGRARSPAPGRPTGSTTRWRRCRGRSWCGCRSARSGAATSCPPISPRQRAKMIILANPNNPSATLVPVDELRRLCDAGRRRARSSSSTRPTSTSRSAPASTRACCPTSASTRTWSCCARSRRATASRARASACCSPPAPLIES